MIPRVSGAAVCDAGSSHAFTNTKGLNDRAELAIIAFASPMRI